MSLALWRLALGGDIRLARGDVEGGPAELLDGTDDIDGLLRRGAGALAAAVDLPSAGPVPADARVLAPIAGATEVWASGVTFERSRTARNEESDGTAFYDHVYQADRPELFFKASAERVRAAGDAVCIRPDSNWNVPEPELALVVDAFGDVAAYTIGNDMSSRSIEGENPLYLPQAKIYTGSCALGPALVPVEAAPPFESLSVELDIRRAGALVFSDSVPLTAMRRTPSELVGWLFRALDFPHGVVLLTGTSIVPPPDFTLAHGDVATIRVPGVGRLVNPVELLVEREGGSHAVTDRQVSA